METFLETALDRDAVTDDRCAYADRWGSIVLVLSTAACIGITLGLFPSLIALNVESRGFDTSWNGVLAAMPAFAGILVGPFVPRAIAVLGPLRTFLLSSALAALPPASSPSAPISSPGFSSASPWASGWASSGSSARPG